MHSIPQLIYLILPVILAGIFNMVFVKLPMLSALKRPMDAGRVLWDGRRLFGDNKTWKGFIGMVGLTALFAWGQKLLAGNFGWAASLTLLPLEDPHALISGAVFGLGYALAELPNSFIKRRFSIPPGKNSKGMLGALFTFVDQADSVAGCIIALLFLLELSLLDVVFLFVFGTGLHFLLNVLLYFAGLKKQAA